MPLNALPTPAAMPARVIIINVQTLLWLTTINSVTLTYTAVNELVSELELYD